MTIQQSNPAQAYASNSVQQKPTGQTPAQGASQLPSQQPSAVLSTEETEFFAHLFPTSAADIRAYRTYDSAGLNTPVRMGTIVDKKA